MLSRVANNLIWMNRYMERGYSIMSLLKENYTAHQDSEDLFSWAPILRTYGNLNTVNVNDNSLEAIDYMIFNIDNPNSIIP